MKKRKFVIAITLVMILSLVTIAFAYKTKLFKSIIPTVKNLVAGEVENFQSSDITVDITNIINDTYPEHEHVWYDEYDETNHWKKCSICKEVKDFAEHTLTTTWALGKESCDTTNFYTSTCLCGYGTIGRKPCVWNGTWESVYIGYNQHDRRCVNCNKRINERPYIDNTKNGILIEEPKEDRYITGENSERTKCVLSDGKVRPCGSSQNCILCKGPKLKNSQHIYSAIANNMIKCTNCGKVRRNFY